MATAAVAAFAYGWRPGSSTEIFYAAADRSMASSWHNFFFAAFDPAGTISLDKLPGAFWIQALSVRTFGAHTWAVALPQVVEGVLTILVLYRAVRRGAGPAAGLVAAGLLAVAPATVTFVRGNVADPLLVLLLVLAADALVAALSIGKHLHLVLAGLWVGLAFQAKMVEAWLVLPALLLAYVVAGQGRLVRRAAWGALMGAVAIAISLSWMAAVSLTPGHDRPFVDGTTNDSIVTQVFTYNGFGRVGRPSPNQVLGRTIDIPALAGPNPPGSATRLLDGADGRDIGWLLPAAVLTIPMVLWARRRRPRTDRTRAAVLLWGTWLLLFGGVFSVSAINTYYLGALAPPIAALLAIAAREGWTRRRMPVVQVAAVGLVAVTVAEAVRLLPSAGTGFPPSLVGIAVGLAALAAGCLVAAAVTWSPGVRIVAAVAVAAAMLAVPIAASASVVTNDLGSFDTPFQPEVVTSFTRSFFGAPLKLTSTLPIIEQTRDGAPDLMATQTSVVGAPFIFATGQEALPIGGYDGSAPEPTVAALRSLVARGQFHLVLTAPTSTDPRAGWVRSHCHRVQPTGPPPPIPLTVSYCLPGDGR